ncbi:MAG: site-specific DNA-methyltransferase, partial [Desulfovibrio sp.]|nr:site-specific DNA-methyltransferase [Desulfovibrio sp.]
NLKPVFEPILWLMKPYKIGTTIADNVLKNGLGAFNEAVINIYDKKPENSFVFSTNKNDSGLHPAQKPLKLIEFLIELVTVKEHVVLDPFAGSGTTLKACQKLKRKYIGFENNNEYYLVAKERLAQ